MVQPLWKRVQQFLINLKIYLLKWLRDLTPASSPQINENICSHKDLYKDAFNLMPLNCTLSKMFLLKMVTFYSMRILPLLFKITRKTTSLLRGKINLYNSSSHNSPKLKAIKMSFKRERPDYLWYIHPIEYCSLIKANKPLMHMFGMNAECKKSTSKVT